MRKRAKKEVKQKSVLSLNEIGMDLEKFSIRVLSSDSKKGIDEVPYKINFKHLGLQKITGGILGGKFIEISGSSGSGKSFLAYELVAECQKMGGYVLFFDGERALEEAYLKMFDIDLSIGTVAISYERDMDEAFKTKIEFIQKVRKKSKNSPILIVTDSYPSYQCKVDLENMEAKKNPRGYMHMQKNGKFSSHIEKFVPFLGETKSTYILLNQIRTKVDPITQRKIINTLCEEVVQFWATQRIQGILFAKLFKEVPSKDHKKGKIKIDTGTKTNWETKKNRAVKPFQKVLVKMRFSKGIDTYSGIDELLINEGKIKLGTTTKDENGEKLKKPVEIFRYGDKSYSTINELVDENKELLEPYWTGTYDDGNDEEEAINVSGNEEENED
jgi:RecA/RadA recombinase